MSGSACEESWKSQARRGWPGHQRPFIGEFWPDLKASVILPRRLEARGSELGRRPQRARPRQMNDRLAARDTWSSSAARPTQAEIWVTTAALREETGSSVWALEASFVAQRPLGPLLCAAEANRQVQVVMLFLKVMAMAMAVKNI